MLVYSFNGIWNVLEQNKKKIYFICFREDKWLPKADVPF